MSGNAACSSNGDEPETVSPMQFSIRDYTIVYGGSSRIPFTGGGDVYKLEASNPEVLGKFGIDIETHQLIINPAKTGESTLNIVDVNTGNTVTLDITVVDFYLSFTIQDIEGSNNNVYFQLGNHIRFIRNEENTKPVEIVFQNHVNFKLSTIAEGHFDIERSDDNIFTMTFSLQRPKSEKIETFEYTMGGDGGYMNIFNSIFEFNWKESVNLSRSTPPIEYKMILTDNSNGCKITCLLQPLKFD
ncbi:MAG: hypothetical protein K2L17_12640 [Muribaculaceae bacterium]|nr:hypothetical protein [Muribaculaceae bacterium]